MATVIVNHITKSYVEGGSLALDGINFSVDAGELFGLIGPDGAGKTSLFRILTTLILPNEGTAMVDGYDVVEEYQSIRKHVGYMPGKFSLYQDLSIEENLNFFATIFNTTMEENYELIKDIYEQIEPFKKRRAGQLSGGMKQKLALCCALIHRPTVLFLDEPTTGVDAVSRKEFWDMLQRLKADGITILVSTPYMDEASLCDRIALIQEGKIMSVDTPQQITSAFPRKLFSIRSQAMSDLLRDLRDHPLVMSCYAFGANHHLTFRDDERDHLPTILHYLQEKNHVGIEMELIEAGIEDCFIDLMGTNEN